MMTGFRGTFVISWSQSELDGIWGAPISALSVGSAWSWTGEAVRVDGPPGVLSLGEAEGMADIRRRAAFAVRRLLGAVAANTSDLDKVVVDEPDFEAGFTVTDGRHSWTVTLIDTDPGRQPLAMFVGDVPPRHVDLWIVSHTIDFGQNSRMTQSPGGVICFTPGTMILTEDGPQPVEDIGEGTRLQTKDNGYEEVVWIGSRRISGARLYVMPHLSPIRFREGALDRDVPDAGLLVSPDHRMVLKGPKARDLFNSDEVLVSARDLVNDRNIIVDRSVKEVTYIHLLLPSHQILFANGVESESFHPASAALSGVAPDQLNAMFERLPEITADPGAYGQYARRVLSQSEAAILSHRAA
ncbi:Hint domain-containing protein [Ponticoccus sp. SC2-23]|uniref:Hint domain-containing protein n=1 Tax=Alexandriicola marinus TaxID=2081710 RepID=UPI000FD97A30|nr:Hint domain-containing protein [Alexandriicola marinus]MBM1220101.1 Hint domain-containing protein [Ponticoccus sp. SC6-9]MBM1224787.1 Hint domain-containing protein [Ponticoccus sp. SC6-15]MBM1228300.1 Hint domain-containing protein [Ponticoccus sp. SC6-38]MBM1234062.1 Hint domain-containing protein [Ponticoccus sp. SC6-45]MBM1238802.1 Hint domain-containing protein [Ponticoccus sp. SC6-49]MBM1242583.1 Hint domain-containing protein [Ponticoccus sp. SC2-64]MBM1247586.1 Hint domain-contai